MTELKITTRPHHTVPEDFTVFRYSVFDGDVEKCFIEESVNTKFINQQSDDIKVYIYEKILENVKSRLNIVD